MSNRIGYINRDFEFPVYQQNSDGTPVAALSTDRFTYTVRQGTATPVISLTGLAYTTATETVERGIIDALQFSATGTSSFYVDVFGIP